MNIFDRVTSKKLGPIMTGTIVGIYSAKDLLLEGPPVPLMEKEYPEWDQGLLVQVKYDKPQRPVSLDQFISLASGYPEFENYSREDFDMAYQNSIKLTKISIYPMDDLELFP